MLTALVIVAILTVGISFLCSLLESSLLSAPLSYLAMKEDEGYKPAIRLKEYKSDIERPLSSILILNTIANTMGAAGIGAIVGKMYGSAAVGIASAIVTVLILVFSEIIPKSIGANYWRHLIGFTAGTIRILIVITYPLVVVAEWITGLISPEEPDYTVSREEVSAMIDEGEEDGVFEADEKRLIHNIIRLDDITAKEIMTPRVVAAIAAEEMTIREFFKEQVYHHHSRIPVYKGDNDEYITGYILLVEALELMGRDQFDMKLGEIRRDISSFHETTPISDIWDALVSKKEHISVIIDDYGCLQGIVTLEDIIETTTGVEIIDEIDEASDMQEYAKSLWIKNKKKRNR
jgi:CBS domain containing-hemolysin-like protein